MVEGQKSTHLNETRPAWIFALAAALSLAVAALLFTVSTLTVQADVPLARPVATLPPAAPAEALTQQVILQPGFTTALDALHGIASWYGSVLDGHLTASGERFNMNAMTACHPTLPFGSVVRVSDLKNHRTVVVRINDRGLLSPGRIIDLSYAAAEQLRIVRSGLAPVSLQVLSLGHPRD
jgi:peptidoglycan lytic transglycosylase